VLLDPVGVVAAVSLGRSEPSVDPSIGCIQFSSGTSGAPKGILLSHEAFFYRSHLLMKPLGLGKSDRTLCTMPLSHTHGAECLLLPTLMGGGTVYLKAPKLSFPLYILQELERLKITFFSTIPQFYDFATKLGASSAPDLGALRLPFCGSAALAKSTAEAFRARYGVHIRQGYGLAELSVICVNMHDGARVVYDSVGKVLEGIEHRLGAEGELCVRSRAMFSGYLNAPELTAEKLRDGWLHTGDVVTVDDDGLFRIVGRKEDFIKVNGFKVYAAEVEKALISLEWIKECAVVGEKTELGSEQLVAHVVPSDWSRAPEVMEREMARHLVGRISDYKLPKRYVTWRELPKSAMGKILKSRIGEGPDPS
jgi:acyl-CoA synthetase (AMP-forming)/AMP-acid ligase II